MRAVVEAWMVAALLLVLATQGAVAGADYYDGGHPSCAVSARQSQTAHALCPLHNSAGRAAGRDNGAASPSVPTAERQVSSRCVCAGQLEALPRDMHAGRQTRTRGRRRTKSSKRLPAHTRCAAGSACALSNPRRHASPCRCCRTRTSAPFTTWRARRACSAMSSAPTSPPAPLVGARPRLPWASRWLTHAARRCPVWRRRWQEKGSQRHGEHGGVARGVVQRRRAQRSVRHARSPAVGPR